MGVFLVLIGTLGFLTALVMLFLRLFTKKGWAYKRIAGLAVAAVAVAVIGAAISPAGQEGYEAGLKGDQPVTSSETKSSPSASPQGSTTTTSSAPSSSDKIEKITVEKSNSLNQPKQDPAAEVLEQAAKKELGRRLKYVLAHGLLDDPNKKNVEVHFRAGSELRKAMLADCADVFERLFSTGVSIHEAVAFVYWDVVDKYGHKSEEVVMKVYLRGETAQKINWRNINRYAFDQVADDLWEIPALRQ